MWLLVIEQIDNGFKGELFEVPADFKSHKVGDRLVVPEEDVLDWMINDNGKMHGGFSLRYQRELLSDAERLAFDEHVGVTEYA